MRTSQQFFLQIVALGMAAVLVLPGCAWRKHAAHRKHPDEPPAGPRRVGTVAVVKEDLHFVLVDVGSLSRPEPGTALKCFSGGTETGILAVSAEEKRGFIAADIVKGEPKVGDEVEE